MSKTPGPGLPGSTGAGVRRSGLLLYWDNVRSERELMKIVCERLDYLWFLGLGLDDEVPNHSVLSKARVRWGREVFEKLFVETVRRCVRVGLVSGEKVHVDGSLIEADASAQSVVEGPVELMQELKLAYAAQEKKLTGNLGERYLPLSGRTIPISAPIQRASSSHRIPGQKGHLCGLCFASTVYPCEGRPDDYAPSLAGIDRHRPSTIAQQASIRRRAKAQMAHGRQLWTSRAPPLQTGSLPKIMAATDSGLPHWGSPEYQKVHKPQR